jgi:hypothetical protein
VELVPYFKTSSILSTKLNSFFRRFYDSEGVPLMYNSPVLCPLTRYASDVPPKRLVYKFVAEDERDAVFAARTTAQNPTVVPGHVTVVTPEEEIQMLTPPAEDSDFASGVGAAGSAVGRAGLQPTTPKYNLRENIKRTPHAFSPRRSGRLEGHHHNPNTQPLDLEDPASSPSLSLPLPALTNNRRIQQSTRAYSGPNPYYDKWIVPCTVDTCDPWSSDMSMEVVAPEDTALEDLVPL